MLNKIKTLCTLLTFFTVIQSAQQPELKQKEAVAHMHTKSKLSTEKFNQILDLHGKLVHAIYPVYTTRLTLQDSLMKYDFDVLVQCYKQYDSEDPLSKEIQFNIMIVIIRKIGQDFQCQFKRTISLFEALCIKHIQRFIESSPQVQENLLQYISPDEFAGFRQYTLPLELITTQKENTSKLNELDKLFSNFISDLDKANSIKEQRSKCMELLAQELKKFSEAELLACYETLCRPLNKNNFNRGNLFIHNNLFCFIKNVLINAYNYTEDRFTAIDQQIQGQKS